MPVKRFRALPTKLNIITNCSQSDLRYANQSSKKMNSMFFFFAIVSLCIFFSFKVVALAEITKVNIFWK